MKLSDQRKPNWMLLVSCGAAFFLSLGVIQLAQSPQQIPAPTGHVNDFAGVVDEKTKQQLENILENLKLKTGIEFAVATLQSTGVDDISDFSLELAKDWNIGARTTAKKSLLLVLAVNEKSSFTRFSRSVQNDLPEGVLGEMGQRMRALVDAGKFSEALNAGVQHFVNSLGQKLAFSTEDFDKAPPAVSTASLPATDAAAAQTDQVVTPASIAPLPTIVDKTPPSREEETPAKSIKPSLSAGDAAESEEVELTLTKPLEERVVALKAFLDGHPESRSRDRATELLIAAQAGIGDERLKKGDSAGGIEQLLLAIAAAPVNSSEKLFSGVISQIPLNLYLRGEPAAASEAAQKIEAKFGNDPKRLVALSSFYVATEQGAEATRLATQAVQLAPELPEAHQGLGRALHISLRLEEAAGEYKRALELDPNSQAARRSLADLERAFGKSEEALALYRQQLEAEPNDRAARTGFILSLLDLGRTDEAKSELEKTLQAEPRNLTLLAGAAYWFAAHDDSDLAFSLARKAVAIEPRYTWSQIALARTLVAQKKPLEAERALRFARQYGKFPTLEYELASTLASAALYDEAAEVLMQAFSLKDGQIETRLGGQAPAHRDDFIALLAPERRASIFQSVAADTETNARLLKALLTLSTLLNRETTGGSIDNESAIAAAKEFASGDDDALVYRQLYAASRLLQKGIGFQTAYELAEAARNTADAGMKVPDLTVAVQAEEFRLIRARAIAAGGTPDIPAAPRNVLSNLLRGRIEDISGWALFNQDKVDQAVDHLKRAVAILPEGTPAARASLWHLGIALDRKDEKDEALSYYVKSYNAGEPDPVRRAIIEQLYRKVNGTLEGLDDRIGPAPDASLSAQAAPPGNAAGNLVETTAEPTSSPADTPATPSPVTPEADAPSSPSASPTLSPSSEAPIITPEAEPSAESPSPSPATESPESPLTTPPSASPTPKSSPEAMPEPSTSPTPETPIAMLSLPAATTAPPARTTARETFTLTGRVKDLSGEPLANVVVVLISPQGTVLASTTDDEGKYSFTLALSSTSQHYRIIPSKDGLTFEPVDRVLLVESDDLKELDFVGMASDKPEKIPN